MAEPGRMHWSKPGALRFLGALRRHGWQATTWQIGHVTGSLNVHCDCTSARMLLEEFGIPDTQDALRCTFSHTTDKGRRVYLYSLRADAARIARNLLDGALVQAPLF